MGIKTSFSFRELVSSLKLQVDYMASSGQDRAVSHGYRSWFQPYRYNQQVDIPIFILDYESTSRKDEMEFSYIFWMRDILSEVYFYDMHRISICY